MGKLLLVHAMYTLVVCMICLFINKIKKFKHGYVYASFPFFLSPPFQINMAINAVVLVSVTFSCL